MKLYRVKVETDLMVVADNESSAVEIAKKNASSEIPVYGKGTAFAVRGISDVPEDWKSIIPYSPDSQESRRCFEIVKDAEMPKKDHAENDLDAIMKVAEGIRSSVVEPAIEVRPETRPDPKPKELDWHETKSGRPLKPLRFIK